jgi:hypothetical protein
MEWRISYFSTSQVRADDELGTQDFLIYEYRERIWVASFMGDSD